jgi:hypothetical protein
MGPQSRLEPIVETLSRPTIRSGSRWSWGKRSLSRATGALVHGCDKTDSCARSRSLSVVVSQQSTETPTTGNPASTVARQILRLDQPIGEALVIPLGMIVRHKFLDRDAQAVLPEKDYAVKAFGFQTEEEPLQVRIQVGRLLGIEFAAGVPESPRGSVL